MDQPDSLHEFVRARGHALSRTAYLLTGGHEQAQDLLQSALAKGGSYLRVDLRTGARASFPVGKLPGSDQGLEFGGALTGAITANGDMVLVSVGHLPSTHDGTDGRVPAQVSTVDPDTGRVVSSASIPDALRWHFPAGSTRTTISDLRSALALSLVDGDRKLVLRTDDRGAGAGRSSPTSVGTTAVYDVRTGTRVGDLPVDDQRLVCGGDRLTTASSDGTREIVHSVDPATGRSQDIAKYALPAGASQPNANLVEEVPGATRHSAALILPGQSA